MNQALQSWIDACAKLCKPERVVWCDGSEAEAQRLTEQLVKEKAFVPLHKDKFPGSYLYRSDPSDVARTEHLTFICSERAEGAGPNNNHMPPVEARAKVGKLFDGAMKGRTMYVVPYCMGPLGSPLSKIGIELTDSAYVVLNMRIMTRMGKPALDQLGSSTDFCKGLHSLGDLSPERRYICHFPEAREIWSVGSGYGGNALLGKKCFALRIASVQGRDEGWMAEHMLILGLESPQGEVTYMAAAFPSACGKTNLAMLVPPVSQKGWKVWTVGDDIAWLRPGPDGRLWAINPEAGFFGVAPGTSLKTNPNAMATVGRNTIFTNVALTADGCPWWEGMDGEVPASMTDWRGRPWVKGAAEPAAHPNSRFTVPARQCPSISKHFEDPQGVPISAFIFGARRARTAPLVYQARDWNHGVFVAASMASETTAAATGAVGVVRRDPMAMLPFCGYNMADYFGHWLRMGTLVKNPPKVFHVNWFRKSQEGRFLWPGFGDNLRVLRWVLGRCQSGQPAAGAVESPIGWLPAPGAIDTSDLDMAPAALADLLAVDKALWRQEVQDVREFFGKFGSRLPAEMTRQLDELGRRVAAR